MSDRANVRKLGVLMATVCVDMLGFAIVFPLVPFYALKFQADPWLIGWIISTFSIAQLASAPLWGRVSDRVGRRPAMLIGLGASALAFLVFAFATNIWMLFLSRLVQGAGGGTTGVAQAYVGDTVEPKDRAKALGWLSAATNFGVMIGPLIGSAASGISQEAPGLIASGLCVINVWFAWRWLPEPARHVEHHSDPVRRSILEVVREVIFAPRGDVPRLVWIYAVGMLGFTAMTAVMALYLHAAFQVTEASIGIFFFYTAMLSIVIRALMLGRLVDRFGEVNLMRLGAISLATGLLLTPFAHTVWLFAITIALVPIGTACLFPATSALVTQRAPKRELGQVLGVQQAFGGGARILAPIWATAAFQGLGIAVPFWIAAGVVGVVTVLAFRVGDARPVEAVG